jgi:hypothetical protein
VMGDWSAILLPSFLSLGSTRSSSVQHGVIQDNLS